MDTEREGEGQADTSDFEAAFAELSGKPADEAGKTEGEGEDAGAAADEAAAKDDAGATAPADATPDPWANAPAELIAERDKIIQERDRAVHSDRSQRGRVAALQTKVEEYARTRTAPPAEDSDEAKARQERRDKLREEYPDVAGPLLDEIEATRRELDVMRETTDTVAADRTAAAELAQLAALEESHPDWSALANDGNFLSWLNDQPQKWIDAANSSDAREVSGVLTLFKLERAAATGAKDEPGPDPKPDARRQQQLEGNRMPAGKPTPAASGAPADFDGAFNTFAARKSAKR